jgi:hypothetical protein
VLGKTLVSRHAGAMPCQTDRDLETYRRAIGDVPKERSAPIEVAQDLTRGRQCVSCSRRAPRVERNNEKSVPTGAAADGGR